MPHKRLLIVEDDPQIITLLQATFEYEGWQIYIAKDGTRALAIVEEESPDLVILDLLLPIIDGFEVCRRIREWSQVPIIILSALIEPSEKVRCLNLGADDYIIKPFRADELLARVDAVLRRTKTENIIAKQPYFNDGYLKFDSTTRQVTVAGKEIKLTPTEYNLLYELVLNKGRILTYNHILKKVWGTEYVTERNYLHVFVRYLRIKIEHNSAKPKYIITIPGAGYRFSDS